MITKFNGLGNFIANQTLIFLVFGKHTYSHGISGSNAHKFEMKHENNMIHSHQGKFLRDSNIK